MPTPFETYVCFYIENAMISFHKSKIAPINSMLTGENQELSRMFDIWDPFKFVLFKTLWFL